MALTIQTQEFADIMAKLKQIETLVNCGTQSTRDSLEKAGQRFTIGEKMILLMLCDLYERLDVKRDDVECDVDPEFVRVVMGAGHYWALSRKNDAFVDRYVSDRVASEASHIMGMWQVLEVAYGRLSEEDQAIVDKETTGPVRFWGFYANDEIDHLSVAHIMIEKLGMFPEFKDRDLDSHMPGGLGAQKRMLEVFDKFIMKGHRNFTASDLITILKEAVHPDNR